MDSVFLHNDFRSRKTRARSYFYEITKPSLINISTENLNLE